MNVEKNKKEEWLTISEIKEIVKNTIKSINESKFDRDIERIKKNWGGELEPEEKFDAMEFFGDAGDAAEEDIKAEFGEDEFAPFGTMEDPRMLKDLEEDAEVTQKGLIRPKDSEGNDIKLKSLVTSIDGVKKGYVVGFGDDNNGSLVVRVDWKWPTDMKFMNPEEMGEKRVKPEEIIVNNIKQNTKDINETKAPETLDRIERLKEYVGAEELAELIIFKMEDSLANSIIDDIEQDYGISQEDEDMLDETGRGLGKGVKNSGDRNIKMRDDNHSAPLTNLDESINESIKKLINKPITKKELKKFISEQALVLSKKINN